MLVQPKLEWPAIAEEPIGTAELYQRYIMPLAAIGPVASFIGMSIVGVNIPAVGYFRISLTSGIVHAILSYALALVGIFVIGLIIDALAPTFGGRPDRNQALKVVAFAWTPAWIAAILHIVPALGILALLASLYGPYLMYLGLPVLMKSPPEKTLGYTAVVVLAAIAVSVILWVIAGLVVHYPTPVLSGSSG